MATILIDARRSTTVLPRCLQILSRRGFILTGLRTENTEGNRVIMHCTVTGPQRWQQAVLPLLARVVEVNSVQLQTTQPHSNTGQSNKALSHE